VIGMDGCGVGSGVVSRLGVGSGVVTGVGSGVGSGVRSGKGGFVSLIDGFGVGE